jgi:hypothetical protein
MKKYLPVRRHLPGTKDTVMVSLRTYHSRAIPLKEIFRMGPQNSPHSLPFTADTLVILTLLKIQYFKNNFKLTNSPTKTTETSTKPVE